MFYLIFSVLCSRFNGWAPVVLPFVFVFALVLLDCDESSVSPREGSGRSLFRTLRIGDRAGLENQHSRQNFVDNFSRIETVELETGIWETRECDLGTGNWRLGIGGLEIGRLDTQNWRLILDTGSWDGCAFGFVAPQVFQAQTGHSPRCESVHRD